MYSVLIVSFFNYGIIYIIAPWNFVEQGARDGDFFSGVYTDFTSQWFMDIGSLVAQTTAINIIFPLVEFLLFWLIRHLKRMIDQRSCCPCDRKKTRAKSIMEYEAIYSGPEFNVHHRLAFVINLIYITFLFGPGCPILFPIALAGLIFNYTSERLRMAYSYTKPPMYDSRLSQHTLNSLGKAPIFYALYSMWLFSNQQVFRNVIPEINSFDLYPLSQHHFKDLFG